MAKISERKEAGIRILVAIISGIILSVWKTLIVVLLIINWIITIFSGKRNKSLAEFSEYWNTQTYKYIRYLTFVSNKRPFPFSSLDKISRFS